MFIFNKSAYLVSLRLAALLVVWWVSNSPLAWAEVPQVTTDEEEGIISIESFNSLLKDYPEHFHWIDVRDHREVTHDGTHAQAKVIPIAEFETKVADLPTDKPIILFCNTGARAGEAYDLVRMQNKNLRVYFLDANLSFNKQSLPKVMPLD